MSEQTYFSVVVDYRSASQGYDSGIQSSSDTETGAMEELSKNMQYYTALHYQITRAHIDKVCSECNGYGQIFVPQKRNPRLGKNKRCPSCRGKAEERVATWVNIPAEIRAELASAMENGKK